MPSDKQTPQTRHSATNSAALPPDYVEKQVGLDYHNLAPQSVFEPSFDLTNTNTPVVH
jgi:hypothetical protein